MQARFSLSIGMSVVEEGGDLLGVLSGILVHPDTGKVEGFFVRTPGFFRVEHLFLPSADIARWGVHITVRHAEVLAPLDDHIRLRTLLADKRPVIGQPMRTESGRSLGRCADVQFHTLHFMVEWLFPRKFFQWGTPLPLSQVLEVRTDAIVLRDTALPVSEKEETTGLPILEMPEAA